jgi:hypothetical protein
MDFVLGTVTLLALATAVAMGVVTWRLVREERRRSAARLAVLAAELQRRQATSRVPRSAERPSAVEPAATRSTTAAPVDVTIRGPEPPRATNEPGTQGINLVDLFGTPVEVPGGWSRRLAGIGMAGIVLLVAVSAAIFISAAGNRENETTATDQVPVELLALNHEREDGVLAISGTIRNPLDGRVATHMIVLALAFDRDGVMVATQRAPLELETLPPGAAGHTGQPVSHQLLDRRDDRAAHRSPGSADGGGGGGTDRAIVTAHERPEVNAMMASANRWGLALALVLLAGGAVAVWAQQPDDQADDRAFRFRTGVELINVTATVTDTRGRFVAGLEKDDFLVYEDGELQTVTHFSNERVPVSLGIVLDTSGSMEGEKMRAAEDAIDRFLYDLLGPEDEITTPTA